MIYLKSYTLPTLEEELDLAERSWSRKAGGNPHPAAYPYGIFPYKGLRRIEFSEVTIFCGGNGSGKSTLLNLIAESLGLPRITPFNTSPYFREYIERMCKWEVPEKRGVAPGSAIFTSDDVFYGLIDRRVENFETEDRRREAEEVYREEKAKMMQGATFKFRSLADYEDLVKRLEVRHKTMSKYVTAHAGQLTTPDSNGQYALNFFRDHFRDDCLFLLDEPENSLSPKYQKEVVKLIEDFSRFFGCQFVISTHSPFFLSMKGALLYDLDSLPAEPKRWWELENMRMTYELFAANRDKFEQKNSDKKD
ncbi:MAG: AAA family ATPase [Clostridia bacterium]|nr:AAA family ATPase [Clostridia bacterium]